MGMQRKKTNDIVRWLQERIISLQERQVDMLPPIQTLARQAACSPVTMQKAVHALHAQGALQPVPRKGTRIVAAKSHRLTWLSTVRGPADHQPRWRAILEQIAAAIGAGEFRPGSRLPTCKELQARFGGGYRSVSRACRELQREGVLVGSGRGWAVSRPQEHTRSGRIVLCARHGTMDRLVGFTPRTAEYLRALESECSKRAVSLELYALKEISPRSFRQWQNSRGVTLGCVAWMLGMQPHERNELAAGAASMRIPLVYYDEYSALALPTRLLRSPLVHCISLQPNEDAGRSVAGELVRLGHRSVCCFDLRETSPIFGRIQGIRRFYDELGRGGEVQLYARKHFDVQAVRSGLDCPLDAETAARLFPNHQRLHPQRVQRMTAECDGLGVQEVVIDRLTGLFAQALAEVPEATAWVCAADDLAVYACHYLRQKGKRIPDDVSVVGFDNSRDALVMGLTSYAFDVQHAALATIDAVLGPTFTRPARAGGRFVVEGHLHVRQSLRAPGG
ncbi:MAG: GntR family transcriptional regulator [Chitinivibrionales bacterium]|nr:GntR family transcriptional regulator [Chitinivibrionales bacterium]